MDGGPEGLMPGVLTRAFPPDTTGAHGNEGAKAGFEEHGFSVATSSPQEGGRSLPMTPQFGQKTGAGSSLAERMQARAGFRVPKLNMPFSTAAGADTAVSGAPSPYLTIPPGLSPATLLESPVFLSNAMGQASPTTGKLFMVGGTNDSLPNRYEGPPQGDGPGAFSFKPLDLRSSHYAAEEKKESSRNNQHPSLLSTQVSIKTESKVQTVQEANLPGQQQLNEGQATLKSSSHGSNKLSRLAPDAAAVTEHVSDEVDGDRVTHGSLSQGSAGAEGDELESKRSTTRRAQAGAPPAPPVGAGRADEAGWRLRVRPAAEGPAGADGQLPVLRPRRGAAEPADAGGARRRGGLKLPMLSPALHHPLLRHRQAMEAAGLVAAPKAAAEVKREAAGAPGGGGGGNGAGAAAAVYQQLMQRSRLPLGHQM
ncbi:hypothetical protein EJB05_39170 [Eragrostis curvula]|uniref:Uncharacterized protein n=1 Tax=Eragrostis curvula TaxID=38414 RepID=A0A5J9TXT2_9POAL|nr:hypothetical protein EJB05_39170 [Eragrostis curvula]